MGLFSKGKKSETANANESAELSNGQTYNITKVVDCMGDSCPRPQLMTKKATKDLASGEVLKVLVDNPTSMEALPPMCEGMSATHLETVANSQGWQVYIQKQ